MIAEYLLPAVRRLILSLLTVLVGTSAQAQVWTLESSIQQATTVAPELRAAQAEVNARARASALRPVPGRTRLWKYVAMKSLGSRTAAAGIT